MSKTNFIVAMAATTGAVILLSYQNCGNFGVTRPSGSIENKVMSPNTTPTPGPEIPCVPLTPELDYSGRVVWKGNATTVTEKRGKFCFEVSESGPILANIKPKATSCSPSRSDLNATLLNNNDPDLISHFQVKGTGSYTISHPGTPGSYALNLEEKGVGCSYDIVISQTESIDGICKDGTPDKNAVGGWGIPDALFEEGVVKSWCVDIDEDAVGMQATINTHASNSCGQRLVILRHTDVIKYPNVTAMNQGGEPTVRISQLGGNCGTLRPGCRENLPGGKYEVRIIGGPSPAGKCSHLNIGIKQSF